MSVFFCFFLGGVVFSLGSVTIRMGSCCVGVLLWGFIGGAAFFGSYCEGTSSSLEGVEIFNGYFEP